MQAQKVSKRILEALKVRNLDPAVSATKAAKAAGVSRKTILNIMNGETWLDLPTIERIERKLGVPIWVRSLPPRR